MKPNGRRRWRKWAKRWRRGLTLARADAEMRRAKSVPMPGLSGAVARKAKKTLAPLPPRPFSPRSLVGMSNTQRKWLARLKHLCLGTDIRVEMEFYRVGERLRPCLVCQWAKCKLPCKHCSTCDGSGVLPARRHKRCGWWLQTAASKNAIGRCGTPLTGGGWLDCQHCGGSGWLPAHR